MENLGKKVTVRNIDGIELEGYYNKQNSSTCIYFVPGFSEEISNVNLALQQKAFDEKISFLTGFTNDYKIINRLNKYDSDGKLVGSILRGATYARFEDFHKDIDAWFKFLQQEGYEKIILVGYCFGCAKAIEYFDKYSPKNVIELILIAPQDVTRIKVLDKHKGMMEDAGENIVNNKPLKLLGSKFLGYCDVSSRTFMSFCVYKAIHNTAYHNKNPDFQAIKKIDVPTLLIIGDKDKGVITNDSESSEDLALPCMQKIGDNIKKSSISIIKGAKHSFTDKEEELSDEIFKFIKQNDLSIKNDKDKTLDF